MIPEMYFIVSYYHPELYTIPEIIISPKYYCCLIPLLNDIIIYYRIITFRLNNNPNRTSHCGLRTEIEMCCFREHLSLVLYKVILPHKSMAENIGFGF